jgi:serine protease Do
MSGRLVGINTAIYSRSGGSLGIGFAIPVTMVRALLDGVDRGTPLVRPWFGASGQDLSAELADSVDRPRPGGVLIHTVIPGSPADRAGLEVGDILLGIDGHAVEGREALRFRIATLPLGGEVGLEVWRDGEAVALTLPVEPPPEDPPRDTTLLTGRHPFSGAVVANLSPALIAELGYDGRQREGVIVLEVRRGSPAARLGLRAGDLIRGVEGAVIDAVADLRARLADPRPSWRLTIQRDDRVIRTVVRG